LLGALLELEGHPNVYIVTHAAQDWFKPIHERQPLIVKAGKQAI
jgi:putative SOS response-associated peptidase YedK